MRKIGYIMLFLMPLLSFGQDIHFSQTTRSEFQINPAFTGAFSGNIRAAMNWKDQWQSINNTYRTYGSSLQFSFGKGRARKPTFFALGVHAYKDVAGDVEIGNTSGGLTFATLLKINRNARFIAGLQGSYGKTGLNTGTMQWGSQYSGLNFDPTLYNGEGIDYTPYQYWDVSMGVAYWYNKNDRNVIHSAPQDARIGLAIYHVNKPFYSYSGNKEDRLPMRIALHGSALFSTQTENLYWYPNLNFFLQGPQHEVLLGSLWKYRLQSASKSTGFTSELSITGGIDMRITNVIDALVPQFYLGFSYFDIGVSYDVNVSNLHKASTYRGGFELSLRFTNPDGYTHRNPMRRAVSI